MTRSPRADAPKSSSTPLLNRRDFHRLLMTSAGLSLGLGCGPDGSDYDEEDARRLEEQKRRELAESGRGPLGRLVFAGYRGLAELPYFELDDGGRLRLILEDAPPALDIHAHLGMAMLFSPRLDLQHETARVRHLLDCDASDPGTPFDLDVYANANFSPQQLSDLRWGMAAQLLWGSASAATHTVPNLLGEMDAMGVERAAVLPIAWGFPFGDQLTEHWMEAIEQAGTGNRLISGASVHPRDSVWREKLGIYAERGARIVKLHPAGQRFFPDDPKAREIYGECGRLGLPVIFHTGRAGIEPTATHHYTLPRRYEGALESHPDVQFVLGHAGARDIADAIPLAKRYPNAWFGIHGQGVTELLELRQRVGTDRLLFGTDWPFYHIAATLAKVLLVTEGEPDARHAILRGNAERMFAAAQSR